MNNDVYVLKELDKNISISEYMKSQGHRFQYVVLRQEIIEANRWISKKLQIPLATKVFAFKKLRIVDDVPKSVDLVYLSYDKVPEIEKMNLANRSFYEVLRDNYNIKVVRNEEELSLSNANEEEAKLLNLEVGSEVLVTHGSTYVNTFEPLEYFEITAVTSFYRYRSVSMV